MWLLHVKYMNIHLCWNLEAWLGLSLLTLNHEFIEIFLSIIFFVVNNCSDLLSALFCSVTSATFSQQKGHSCSQLHHPWNPLSKKYWNMPLLQRLHPKIWDEEPHWVWTRAGERHLCSETAHCCGNSPHELSLLQVTCKCRMKMESSLLKDHEVGGFYIIYTSIILLP